MPIEEESEIGLDAALAMPTVLLNRKLRRETVPRVVAEPVVERRIEKPLVVTEMIGVGHWQHASPGCAEDFEQQPMDVLELGLKAVEQRVVIVLLGGGSLEFCGDILQRARDVEYDALPPEFVLGHGLPVTREAFVASTLGPDIGKALCLLLVTQQLPL